MSQDINTNEINGTINSFLNSLTMDELRSLINDSNQESRLEEFIKNCSIVKNLEKEKELLIEKNKSLAMSNCKKQPIYNETRKVLEESHKRAVELKQVITEKQKKLEKLKPKITPDKLRGLLQVAAQESEEQSEEIAKHYLSKQITYEKFIDEFIKKRTIYHLRRIKYEKLIDSIQNQSLNTSESNLFNQNNLPTNNPPYPILPNTPFIYQPIHPGIQPVRSAPLPPHMANILPPYPTPSYTPFSYNPNHR